MTVNTFGSVEQEPITPSPSEISAADPVSQEPYSPAVPGTASHVGPAWRAVLRELLETVVLTLIIFLMIRTVVQNFRVDGLSMEPSFHDGQFLLINKLAYRLGEPERGDVIVFHYPRDPSRDFIKRVIGLPGDSVRVLDGQVFINGEALTDPIVLPRASYDTRETTLGPDELYVLGDNRPNSSDSHSWGALSLDLVVGEVMLSYWPPEHWGLVPSASAYHVSQ